MELSRRSFLKGLGALVGTLALPIPLIAHPRRTYAKIAAGESLHDIIYNIDPTQTPFMETIGRGSATSTMHEWQTDELLPRHPLERYKVHSVPIEDRFEHFGEPFFAPRVVKTRAEIMEMYDRDPCAEN